MKSILCTFIAVIFIFTLSVSANATAQSAKILFWFPGEAGKTSDAQPILDEFLGMISKQMDQEKLSGTYINDIAEGLAYISREKPKVAVASYFSYVSEKDSIGADIILSTVTAPAGKTSETYSLVGPANSIATGARILSTEPLTEEFVRKALFSAIPPSVKFVQTDQMLIQLKNIGEGRSKDFAILTPSEAFTISKLSFPWAKQIKVIETSRVVPSALVLLLDKSWSGSAKFQKALLEFGKSSDEKEILKELRLVGFAKYKGAVNE